MNTNRCEFCNARLLAWRDRGNYWQYACGTRRRWCSWGWSITRTRQCRRREIERLVERVDALEAKPKRKPKAQ